MRREYLREYIGDVHDVDRRLRDRPVDGWKLHTYQERDNETVLVWERKV